MPGVFARSTSYRERGDTISSVVQGRGKASFAESVNSWDHAKFDEQFALTWPFDGTGIANRKFSIAREDDTIIHGITDAEGNTGLQRGLLVEGMQLRIHCD